MVEAHVGSTWPDVGYPQRRRQLTSPPTGWARARRGTWTPIKDTGSCHAWSKYSGMARDARAICRHLEGQNGDNQAYRAHRRPENGTLTACGMRVTERLADQQVGGSGRPPRPRPAARRAMVARLFLLPRTGSATRRRFPPPLRAPATPITRWPQPDISQQEPSRAAIAGLSSTSRACRIGRRSTARAR